MAGNEMHFQVPHKTCGLDSRITQRIGSEFRWRVCVCTFSFEQFSKPGCINPDVQRQTIEALLTSAGVPSSRFLRPEFIRLAPPLHTSDDEVRAFLTCCTAGWPLTLESTEILVPICFKALESL